MTATWYFVEGRLYDGNSDRVGEDVSGLILVIGGRVAGTENITIPVEFGDIWESAHEELTGAYGLTVQEASR